MYLYPLAVLWGLLALVLIVVALYRSILARQEDDMLHVGGAAAASATAQQVAMAKKLTGIERWVKILGVSLLVYSVLLAALYIYRAWMMSSQFAG
jgi:hypothetical protein